MFSFLTIEQYSSTEDFCPAKTSFNEFKDEDNYSSSNGYEKNFIFSKISSYFSLKYALSVSHSQCFLESGKTRFALGSQKEKNPSTKVSSWEAKYMLSDFFPASEMIPEKNRFLPRHCKTLVEMENEIIFTRSHFHFLGNWASAAKNVTCLQNIISLWHSAIIMRKCAQFSIRVTFSRTLYMYIVDFPQLQRTEDLTKGFKISPNLSMSPAFKLSPNVSIQVSELNPDREFMSVCCITTWNKDLKEMLRIVSKNHDYYYYYYELDLYFLLWIGDGPFPLGETGALENFFIIIGWR